MDNTLTAYWKQIVAKSKIREVLREMQGSKQHWGDKAMLRRGGREEVERWGNSHEGSERKPLHRGHMT